MLMDVECTETARIVPLRGWYFLPLNKTDYESVQRGVVSAVHVGILEGNMELFAEADTQVHVKFNQEELLYRCGYQPLTEQQKAMGEGMRDFYEKQNNTKSPHVLPFLLITKPERISDNLISEVTNRINEAISFYTCIYPGITGRVTEDNQIDWRPEIEWFKEQIDEPTESGES